MALPRSEGGDIAEKAAINRHFATLHLFMRLLNEFHGFAPFPVICGSLPFREHYTISIFILCQFLAMKEKF
ncbi:MAG: hypothetical protein IKE94_03530 [Aeriscardovia sp.]|jgi:hypothetical protein|nr:hypothetical protein [Oscillospiraceae bacterium]MBR2553914.1 hypothetical protein [Aeriscardovia sp.]MBR3241866.1 hypothetical protein [Parasporobacterium sp.]